VLQVLAERADLSSLLAQGATIPGSALAHGRAAVAAPFARMGGYNLCIAAADVPALTAVLAAAQQPADRLRSLGLLIDVVGATSRLAPGRRCRHCRPRAPACARAASSSCNPMHKTARPRCYATIARSPSRTCRRSAFVALAGPDDVCRH
jgi:hypothetical protein